MVVGILVASVTDVFAYIWCLPLEFPLGTVILRLILATFVGGVIGYERGRHGSAAGLRTHILVCVGATMTALTGLYANRVLGSSGDFLRLSAQVVSGIGFLGAGMITQKSGSLITGLTTAAGMWATATTGIALGLGFYSGAFLATLICLFAAAVMTRFERRHKTTVHLYLELVSTEDIGHNICELRRLLGGDVFLETRSPKSGLSGRIGVQMTLSRETLRSPEAIRAEMEAISGVIFVIWES